MNLITLSVASAVALSVIMAGAWAIARKPGLSGWTDAIWSLAVGVVGVALAVFPLNRDSANAGLGARQMLVAVLVGIWALRLGGHIARRTAGGGGDDPRYAELRRTWGRSFDRRLFWFLQIQALAGWFLTLSIMVAARNGAPAWSIPDYLGTTVLIVAILGEAVADAQLQAFRNNPANAGRVCDTGLWSLSRHPNYFFEWLCWCAYPLIAIGSYGLPISDGFLVSVSFGRGWLAWMAPIMMYWLLVHVSGIPPLEAHMLRSRGNLFRAVQMRVSAFWPRPARRF